MAQMPSQDVVLAFEQGAPLVPAAELVAWLDGQGDVEVRLPVLLQIGALGVQLQGARVGFAADAPVIELDDGALGISLSDRMRQAGGREGRVAASLEGRWRSTSGGGRVLVVRRFVALIADAERAACTHAEVQAKR